MSSFSPPPFFCSTTCWRIEEAPKDLAQRWYHPPPLAPRVGGASEGSDGRADTATNLPNGVRSDRTRRISSDRGADPALSPRHLPQRTDRGKDGRGAADLLLPRPFRLRRLPGLRAVRSFHRPVSVHPRSPPGSSR